MHSDNNYIRQAGDEPVLTTTANYHHKTVEGIDKGISRINCGKEITLWLSPNCIKQNRGSLTLKCPSQVYAPGIYFCAPFI